MRTFLLVFIGVLCAASLFLIATPAHAAADSSIYDRGPSAHARGTINGSQYHVARGDTIFSIANRFGVSQHELMRVNGIHNPRYLRAGSTLTIPGLGPNPWPTPTPTPYPGTPCAYITITSPTAGAQVGAVVTVSGRARVPCTFTVRALDDAGRVLREAAVTVSGATGTDASWTVTLNIGAVTSTSGRIVAVSGNNTLASVAVRYSSVTPICNSSVLSISAPAANERVGTSFTVSGVAGANCTVTVRALDSAGRELAAGSQVANSSGGWSVPLTVYTGVETAGRVEVRTNAGGFQSRQVIFGSTSLRYLEITAPVENASLPATFTVSGRGAGLFEGNVVIRAVSDGGAILFEQATTLQGTNVGAGGEGTFTLAVTVSTSTPGYVEAFNTDSALRDSVRVFFNGGGGPIPGPSSFYDFRPGECRISPRVNAPAYSYPDGPQTSSFTTGGTFDALRGVRTGTGDTWYLVDFPPGVSTADSWVRATDLTTTPASCTW